MSEVLKWAKVGGLGDGQVMALQTYTREFCRNVICKIVQCHINSMVLILNDPPQALAGIHCQHEGIASAVGRRADQHPFAVAPSMEGLKQQSSWCKHPTLIRGSLCESGEVLSFFPEKWADLRGSLGNFWGSQGSFQGKSGNLRGTSGLLFNPTVTEAPGKSPGTSEEVRGTSGDFPKARGGPDSQPATRPIYLWP